MMFSNSRLVRSSCNVLKNSLKVLKNLQVVNKLIPVQTILNLEINSSMYIKISCVLQEENSLLFLPR